MTVEPSKVLTAYQSEFVWQFLSPGSEKRQWLTAPPGSGLAQCAQEIVSRLITETPSARILILTGRALVLQWMRRLEDAGDSQQTIEGSRRNLRELSEEKTQSTFSWPEGHVVVMDSWAMERFSDLQASVFRTNWALVVWEGFRASMIAENSGRTSLVERLGQAQEVERLLVLSHDRRPTSAMAEPELPWAKRTTWGRSVIERSYSAAQRPGIEETTLKYVPSEAEIGLRIRLEEFVRRWLPDSPRFSPMSRLLAAAESSPPALQEYLQRLRPSKSSIVLQRADPLNDIDLAESALYSSDPAKLVSQLSQITEEVSAIQDCLDGLSVDSKLEALLMCLKRIEGPRSRTFIECRFAATARYLRAALTELPHEVFLVTSDLPAKETLRILSAFEERGTTLIATSAALQAVEFSADTVIVYEFNGPWMRSAFRPRLRVTEEGRPIQVIYLVDDFRNDLQAELLEEP